MLTIGPATRIFLAAGATDMRKSFDTLFALTKNQIGIDPHRFSFPYQGLDNRLIGPTEEGRVLRLDSSLHLRGSYQAF